MRFKNDGDHLIQTIGALSSHPRPSQFYIASASRWLDERRREHFPESSQKHLNQVCQ
jgi:hypothetical protein